MGDGRDADAGADGDGLTGDNDGDEGLLVRNVREPSLKTTLKKIGVLGGDWYWFGGGRQAIGKVVGWSTPDALDGGVPGEDLEIGGLMLGAV